MPILCVLVAERSGDRIVFTMTCYFKKKRLYLLFFFCLWTLSRVEVVIGWSWHALRSGKIVDIFVWARTIFVYLKSSKCNTSLDMYTILTILIVFVNYNKLPAPLEIVFRTQWFIIAFKFKSMIQLRNLRLSNTAERR